MRYFGWWVQKSGDHQLRLVVYPRISRVLYTSQMVLAGFLNHQPFLSNLQQKHLNFHWHFKTHRIHRCYIYLHLPLRSAKCKGKASTPSVHFQHVCPRQGPPKGTDHLLTSLFQGRAVQILVGAVSGRLSMKERDPTQLSNEKRAPGSLGLYVGWVTLGMSLFFPSNFSEDWKIYVFIIWSTFDNMGWLDHHEIQRLLASSTVFCVEIFSKNQGRKKRQNLHKFGLVCDFVFFFTMVHHLFTPPFERIVLQLFSKHLKQIQINWWIFGVVPSGSLKVKDRYCLQNRWLLWWFF